MSKHDPLTPAAAGLQNQAHMAEAIIAGLKDAIVVIDGRQNILFFNAAAEEMFRCSSAEAIGASLSRFVPERFRDGHRAYVEEFRKTGVTRREAGHLGALRALRADGEEFSIEASIARVEARHERLLAVSIRDVTAREQAEALLRDSEERYRAVVQNVVDGVITIDEHGIVLSLNTAAERLFGYSPSELRGRNVSLLMPEPHCSQHDRYIENYRRTGEAKIMGGGREVFGRRKNGSVFPMNLAISEFRLGQARFFTGLVRDITERKEADARLEFYTRELAAKNAALEQSNQELDDFAYIASHDLKEPLRGIHNYAGFLIEDHGERLDDDGRAKLETVKRLAQRLENLIDSLLTFSRVGRAALAIQPTDLNKTVAEVLDSLSISLKQKAIETRVRPLPVLRCDKVRVAEVFRNLITNAMKYNDKPEKWIEIGVLPQDGKETLSGALILYVRDNGIGIPDKHARAIFQIFKRLHPRGRYGEGTGAGLTIVKKIIERHGGRIWVESVPGEGSTFYFTLAGEDHSS